MNALQQIIYKTPQALALKLAQSLFDDIQRDIKKQDHAFLVLPGGSSPRGLITELARLKPDWSKITVTTTDERCVPLEDEHSNAGQIHRLAGIVPFCLWQKGHPAEIKFLPWPTTATILGMGLDGHIASLFTKEHMAVGGMTLFETALPSEPYQRVSLTFDTLLQTHRLILLVMGAKKQALCHAVLQGEQQDTPLAHLLKEGGDRVTLYIANS